MKGKSGKRMNAQKDWKGEGMNSKLDDENADHGESDEEGPVAAPPPLEEHRPWVELPHLSSRFSADDPLPLKVFGNSTLLDAIVTAFHLDFSHIITNPLDSNLNIYQHDQTNSDNLFIRSDSATRVRMRILHPVPRFLIVTGSDAFRNRPNKTGPQHNY
ncbi:hypothetical protein C4D60_Mb05t10560 [Musa balbisiana]|uniref:Uncharacterized protein n=1 Tax=Musa balbisiana TaxID=52838 RepID=A0A4S8JV47_MUSBA|nr:hypothetical protein C4D60_Mb05t10560 [Musa balbisiana]